MILKIICANFHNFYKPHNLKVKDKKDDTEEDEDDDDEDDEGIKRTVNNCFKDIVNTLINNNPRLIFCFQAFHLFCLTTYSQPYQKIYIWGCFK